MKRLQKSLAMVVLGCSFLLPFEVSRAAAESGFATSTAFAEPAQEFPGTVRVESDSIAHIQLQMPEEYEDASFFLVAYNERGKEAKRRSIDEDDEEIDLKGWALPKGKYEILLEMKQEDKVVRSTAAAWTVEVEYDSDEPPGSIDVLDDGTIWVNVIQNRSDRGEGSFYLVVRTDKSNKLVKQMPIAPQDTRFAASGLQLPPGKYEVYVEWAKDKEVLRSNRKIWEIKEEPKASRPAGVDFPGSIKDMTFVLLRSIFEALGAKVDWGP